jgi:hypothetical protein
VKRQLTSRPIRDALVTAAGSAEGMTGFPMRRQRAGTKALGTALEEEEDEGLEGTDEDDAGSSSLLRRGGSGGAQELSSPTVDAHVTHRMQRAARRARRLGRCDHARAWLYHHVLFSWAFGLSMLLLALALMFQYGLPPVSFGQNAASTWMYFLCIEVGVLLPFQAAEHTLFLAAARLSRLHAGLAEVVDFLDAAHGILPYVSAVVMALLLQGPGFQLVFSDSAQFYFSRTMGALLALLLGLLVKRLALKATLRRLYLIKHAKKVRDVVFYEEVARFVSAPRPALGGAAWRAQATRHEQQQQQQDKLKGDGAGAAGSSAAAGSRRRVGVAAWDPAAKRAGGTGGGSSSRALAAEHVQVDLAEEPSQPTGEQDNHDDGGAIRRTITPTLVLEHQSFWQQAAYVRRTDFTLCDADVSGTREGSDWSIRGATPIINSAAVRITSRTSFYATQYHPNPHFRAGYAPPRTWRRWRSSRTRRSTGSSPTEQSARRRGGRGRSRRRRSAATRSPTAAPSAGR